MKTNTPELAIIIVSYNVRDFLEQALVSIKKALGTISSEIWVVDNASTDNTVGFVKRDFPEVRLIENKKNVGFAAANNIVLKKSNAKYFCLINPDTIVQEDTFSTLLTFLKENERAGMVGCKILNPNGTLQLACRRSFPTAWVAFCKITGLSQLFPKSRTFGRYNLTYLDPDSTSSVEAISGSFMMVRREVVEKVGLLDEQFFMYGEDLDWCYRIQQAGWKIYYLPKTKIIHFKGESSRRSQFDSLRLFYRAMHLFVVKHYKSSYFYIPQWLLLIAIWAKAFVSMLKQFSERFGAQVFDIIIMYVSLCAAVYLRFEHFNHLPAFLAVTIFYMPIWLLCLIAAGSYGEKRYAATRAASAVLLGLIINSAFTFFFRQYAFSRAVLLIAGVMNLFLITGWRIIIRFFPKFGIGPLKVIAGERFVKKRTLIVGDEKSAGKLLAKLQDYLDNDYQVVGILNVGAATSTVDIASIPVFHGIEKYEDIVTHAKVKEIIFSTDKITYDIMLDLMSNTREKKVSFKLVPSNFEVIIGKASIDRIGEIPMIDVDYKLHNHGYQIIKRVFDICIAGCIVVLLSPVMLFTRVIKRTKIHIEVIKGQWGNPVVLHEFRSTGNVGWQDTLPRFWSVLRGGVSIVGKEIQSLDEGSESRLELELKPGLTGLNQLKRSKKLSARDKERQNLYYLKNYSPLLDAEIILKSIFGN